MVEEEFIRIRKGRKFTLRLARKGTKKKEAKKREKDPDQPRKPERLSPAGLKQMRALENEIVRMRKAKKSAETIARELTLKTGLRVPTRAVLLFFKVLIKEKKLKKMKIKPKPEKMGPNESTRKLLDPHQAFILESYAKGVQQQAIVAELRRRGANVSYPTLRRYHEWVKEQKKKKKKKPGQKRKGKR